MLKCRFAILLLLAPLVLPLAASGGLKTALSPNCPQTGDTVGNSDVDTFTSYGLCDKNDMIYGVMFKPNSDIPIGYGTPAPGDPGGSDGKWVLRFRSLADGDYVMRIIGWMSNDSKDTSFTVDHTKDPCSPAFAFMIKQTKLVKVPSKGKVALEKPAPMVVNGKKTVTFKASVDKDNLATAHAEITRIVCGKGQVEVVKTWRKTEKQANGNKTDVSITYDIDHLTTGDIYKVRLTATATGFNDFDIGYLEVP